MSENLSSGEHAKVSVVIVLHSNYSQINSCIDSITKTTRNEHEIILVNNGDQEFGHRALSAALRIENRGYSNALNTGFKLAKGDYILACNPDVEFADGAIDRLKDYMDRHPEVGVSGPRVLGSSGLVQASARRFPTPLTFLFHHNSVLTRLFPNNRHSRSYLGAYVETSEPCEVDWLSGCCMLIRREAFEEAGGFDERYFLFMEDVDFCWRVWNLKRWSITYYPHAHVVHDPRSDKGEGTPSLIRYRHASIRAFIDRFFGDKPVVLRGIAKVLISLRERLLLVFAALRDRRL